MADFNLREKQEQQQERKRRLSKKKQAILWRRSKVLELYMSGHTLTNMSDILKVSPSLISSDLYQLRMQSKQTIQSALDREIPLQFTKTRAALQYIQRHSLEVYKNAKSDSIRLAALSVFSESQREEFALLVNGEVVDQSIKFVKQQENKLNKLSSHQQQRNNSKTLPTQAEEHNSSKQNNQKKGKKRDEILQ
jgi:hypothetical protein